MMTAAPHGEWAVSADEGVVIETPGRQIGVAAAGGSLGEGDQLFSCRAWREGRGRVGGQGG